MILHWYGYVAIPVLSFKKALLLNYTAELRINVSAEKQIEKFYCRKPGLVSKAKS